MMMTSRPSGARRERRISRPFSSTTVTILKPSGRVITVTVSLPRRSERTSRDIARKRSFSS